MTPPLEPAPLPPSTDLVLALRRGRAFPWADATVGPGEVVVRRRPSLSLSNIIA